MISLYQFTQFILVLFLIFSLPFELPLAMAILILTGLIQPRAFREHRRIVYLAIAVFAAVVTPDPTPVSMVALALALFVLYELGIWTGVLLTRSGVGKQGRPGL
jgi:sec-independent protein translocase protein TatC